MSDEGRLTPFPEARPPHVPDAVARRSPWVYGFLAVALIDLSLVVRSGLPPATDIESIVVAIISTIPAVVAPLLGVALFNRDRNAWRTMPLLAFGVVLLTLGSLLTAVSSVVIGFLIALTPTDPDPFTPAVTAFGVLRGLLSVFAVLYVAAGLAAARRMPRSRVERPLLVWLVALGVISAVLSIGAFLAEGIASSPSLLVQVGLGIVLSLASTFAWAYLAAITVGGAVAGESPQRAWRLAAIAVGVLIVSPLVSTAIVAVTIAAPANPLLWVVGVATALAWLLLLAAFVMGVPSPAPATVATADPPGAMQPGS